MSKHKEQPKTCSFQDCGLPYLARGLCGGHWRQQSLGKPLTPLITHESLEARLEKNIKRDPDGGCWWWIGSGSGKYYKKDDKSGYGQLRWKGQSYMAHRYTYAQYHGVALSSEDTLDHLCRNTRCVNPEHLEKVSRSENIERKHLYHALRSENERFRAFIQSKGYDPESVLGGGQ